MNSNFYIFKNIKKFLFLPTPKGVGLSRFQQKFRKFLWPKKLKKLSKTSVDATMHYDFEKSDIRKLIHLWSSQELMVKLSDKRIKWSVKRIIFRLGRICYNKLSYPNIILR